MVHSQITFNIQLVYAKGRFCRPYFLLFIEDFETYLQREADSGLNIEDIVNILLLFVDDMAIFGKSPEELQSYLKLLYEYCNTVK